MIEPILTILIVFAAPLPWWMIVVHLVKRKSSKIFGVFAYLSVAVPWLILGLIAFLNQDLIFGDQFETSFVLQGVAVLCMICAVVIDWQVITKLGFKRLVCVSELEGKGKLVTTGVYRYARHPRYVEFPLWAFGFGLLLGYYFLLWFGFYLFISLWIESYFEEAELVERFGDAYRQYQKKVRRFFIF